VLLQCIAVCWCSALQYVVAVCCSFEVLPWDGVSILSMQHATVRCCSVSQCVVAIHCKSKQERSFEVLPWDGTGTHSQCVTVCCCSVLQCVGAVRCSTLLQCAAVSRGCRGVTYLKCASILSVSKCVGALCCSVLLQCVAVCYYSILPF